MRSHGAALSSPDRSDLTSNASEVPNRPYGDAALIAAATLVGRDRANGRSPESLDVDARRVAQTARKILEEFEREIAHDP